MGYVDWYVMDGAKLYNLPVISDGIWAIFCGGDGEGIRRGFEAAPARVRLFNHFLRLRRQRGGRMMGRGFGGAGWPLAREYVFLTLIWI